MQSNQDAKEEFSLTGLTLLKIHTNSVRFSKTVIPIIRKFFTEKAKRLAAN